MSQQEQDTKRAILQTARELFIEKGFSGTKTTEIAKRAGINHAMLHYYYATKQNLFNIVYKESVNSIASSFLVLADEETSFTDMIVQTVERHFDFVKENYKIVMFVLNEMDNHPENITVWKEMAKPIFSKIMMKLNERMQREINAGNIRNIDPLNFIVTAISMNIFVFEAKPLLKIIRNFTPKEFNEFIENRKKESVRLVLLSLKPEN